MKMTKLAKFGLTIPIFEGQTKQLLCGFEDDEIPEIRTDHTYFWKPNRTTTTTQLQRRWNYRNSGWPYPFLKAKQNNNNYSTSKTTKLPKFGQIIPIFESQTEQQLLYDFKDDEITEIWTDHTHFWKPSRTATTTPFQRRRNYLNSSFKLREIWLKCFPMSMTEFLASQKKGIKRTLPLCSEAPPITLCEVPPIWVIFVSIARYCWENLIFICEFRIFVPQFGYSVELLHVWEGKWVDK